MAMAHPLFQMERSMWENFKKGKNMVMAHLLCLTEVNMLGSIRMVNRTVRGVLTYADGEKYVGEYYDGKTWNGILYNKLGNKVGKYVNGEAQ